MLERFLCIRRGERKSILFFSLLSFSWSIAASFGVAFSDALFLKYVGTQCLPFAFIVTAIGMLCISGILLYFYNKKEISQIFKKWIYASLIFYFVSFLLLISGTQHRAFFIAFKAGSSIVQIGFFSCFWSFVDQYFDLQNAKRLFGIFYSAIFLGTAVCGALLSLPQNEESYYGMLCLITVSLFSSLFFIYYIQKKLVKLPDDHQEFAVIKTDSKTLFKAITSSPFTVLLLSFCVFLQILLVITEYEYMFGLQQFFKGSSDNDLMHFLGRLYLFGALFNILFGIFLYGRLIKKAGLNNVLLIVPLFFTSLFCGLFVSAHLIFSVMGFIAVEGVLVLVEDNNFTLLLNAVPLKVKNKIRVICESLIEPFGILISSILMLLFQAHSKMLGLSLSILFLVVALLLRAYYTKGIFYNLISHVINFNPDKSHFENSLSSRDYHQSKPDFIQQFLSIKPKEQFFLIECALKFNDLEFLNTLLEKITKLSNPLKIKVMDTFCDYPQAISDNFLPLMHQWAKKDPEINYHLIFHKAKMELIEPEDELLLGQHPLLRASKYLLELRKDPASSIGKKGFLEMLSSDDENEIGVAIEALRFSSKHLFTSKLIDLLLSKPTLKETILKTLSVSLNPVDAPFLSSLLIEFDQESHISFRALYLNCIDRILNAQNLETLLLHSAHWTIYERKALLNMVLKMKSDITPTLVTILEDPRHPDKARLLAGEVLSKINKKTLKKSFQALFDEEIRKAYLYYYHYITVQKSYPYADLELLQLTLKNSYNSILDFIIQIQAHMQKFDKGEYLAQSLRSSNPKTMSHAIETLQKLCSYKLFKKLLPLVEVGHERQFFKTYHQQRLPIFSLDALLDLLERSSSNINRMIVFSLKNRLNIKGVKAPPLRDSNFELKIGAL